MAQQQRKSLSYFDSPHGRIRDVEVLTQRDGTDLLFPYFRDADIKKKQVHHHVFLDNKRNAIGIAYVIQNKEGKWGREYWYDSGWGWKQSGNSSDTDYYDSPKELYEAIEARRDIRRARNFATYLAARVVLSYDEIMDELSQKAEIEDNSCFIATVVYSTSKHPDLDTFRQFRDTKLLSNKFGRGIVNLYYKVGPTIAHYIDTSPVIKRTLRYQLEKLAARMRG